PLAIALLEDLERRRDMDLEEADQRLAHVANLLARRRGWRDRRADRDAAVLRDLARDIADAQDVEIAMLLREAELTRQVLAHDVAVEQRDRPAAHLHELDHQRICDRRLAGARKAGEEHREALLVPPR